MKIENVNVLNEVEEEKVAGGLPYIIPHHLPHTQPAAPQEPAEPQEGGAEGTW